jgi:hypothetical protein
MKTQTTILPMKLKPMLIVGLVAVLFNARTTFAQVISPPDGNGSELAPVTSVPDLLAPPVLTPFSQVIVTGGLPPAPTPITVTPPAVDTTVLTPVYVNPSSVLIAGGISPLPGPSTNFIPVVEVATPSVSEKPTIIGAQKSPAFRSVPPLIQRRIQIVRPGVPLLKPH